jgi:crossover junction endodeoxyribonuclease RuvC
MSVRVLGLDPGLASFGWAVADLEVSGLAVVDVGVFCTVKSARKHGVLAADDGVRRARELGLRLAGLLDRHRPAVVCAEAMSHPRHASSAGKLAMAWGVVAAELERRGLPLAMESPQGIKKALTGARDASKEDVGAALLARWPGLAVLLAPLPKGLHEHAQDALAAIVACETAEVVRLARAMGRAA